MYWQAKKENEYVNISPFLYQTIRKSYKSGSIYHFQLTYELTYPFSEKGIFTEKPVKCYWRHFPCPKNNLQPKSRNPLISLQKTPRWISPSGFFKQGKPCFQQSYKDLNLEMTESESVIQSILIYNGIEPRTDVLPEVLGIYHSFLQILICFVCR